MDDVSNLAAHVGYWLRMVSNAVSQDFARKISKEGVTVAEWTFMRVLYDHDAISPTALAEKMGMTKGAISKLADRLLEKGLLAREDNPGDKRAHSLSLTLSGRRKVPTLAALADANDVAHFGVLTPQEREDLDRIVKALVQRRGLTSIPMN